MPKIIRALSTLLAVLIVGFAVGACGDDEETPAPSGDQAKTIVIGSKNFAEQYILGEIYAQALEAEGFKVEKQLDLGSEQIAYKALKGGRISAYPEYSGTALTSFYGVKTDDVERDPEASYQQLVEAAEADGITAMPQTSFENTYVLVSTADTAEQYGNPTTISEMAEAAGDNVKLSGFPECRQRADCLLGINRLYDWHPQFVSSQGKYADLDEGQADFTFGFGTDGELALDKYHLYEDDKGLYPPYYVSLLVNEEGMEALGEKGRAIIERIQEPLDLKVMQELNSRVTIDKEEPEQVAADYLREAGFVK